jgi:hypothetical protein
VIVAQLLLAIRWKISMEWRRDLDFQRQKEEELTQRARRGRGGGHREEEPKSTARNGCASDEEKRGRGKPRPYNVKFIRSSGDGYVFA